MTNVINICDRACKNQPCERKKNRRFFQTLLYHNLRMVLYKHNKISVTTAEFNGLSSEIYRNWIPHSELKILPRI